MRRAVRILAVTLVAVVVFGYGAASAVIWDRLTKVDGACHPEWAANDPTTFNYPDYPVVDTAAYAMRRRMSASRAATPESRSAGGGFR